MARPVTRSELARMAGVSPAAITKACKGTLADARIGKRVDLDHPAVRKYLAAKDATPTLTLGSAPKRSSRPSQPRPKRRRSGRAAEALGDAPEGLVELSPEELEDLAHMLDEVIKKYGTTTALKDWLDSRKKIADILEKDLKIAETKGRLIERQLVKTHVFGAIEAGNRRLLGDSSKTIARRLYALAKSGAPVEEAEATVREILSSQLTPVKTTAARVLRNA